MYQMSPYRWSCAEGDYTYLLDLEVDFMVEGKRTRLEKRVLIHKAQFHAMRALPEVKLQFHIDYAERDMRRHIAHIASELGTKV